MPHREDRVVPGVPQRPPVSSVMGNPLSGEAAQFQVSLMLQTIKGLLLESRLLTEAVTRHLARALEVQALAVTVQTAMVLGINLTRMGMAAARIMRATLLTRNSTMPRLKRMTKRRLEP